MEFKGFSGSGIQLTLDHMLTPGGQGGLEAAKYGDFTEYWREKWPTSEEAAPVPGPESS